MPALARLSRHMDRPQDGLLQLLRRFNEGVSDDEGDGEGEEEGDWVVDGQNGVSN